MAAPRRELATFLIKVGAVTVAALAVMFAAKTWFLAPQKPSDGTISWKQAGRHVGEYATIEGTVVATHRAEKACFLNFSDDWKSSFSLVIFASRFDKFPAAPEDHYRGKRVRVTGLIKDYKGRPEIVLESPDQIEILP